MKFIKLIKTGKRIFCWLLAFALIVGQSASLVYAGDMEGSEENTTYAVGDVIEVDGIKYRICDGYAEVASNQNIDLSGSIVIPGEVSDGSTSYPVVLIADKAFENCENIKSVEIPDSVTSIGEEAFINCHGMEEVKLSENLQIISYAAFDYCQSLKKVDIPDSVTYMGQCAFARCYGLEEVRLPENLQTIEDSSFINCESLKKVEIPNSVMSIGNAAFDCCIMLEEVRLSENLQTIGNKAFQYCYALKRVEMPDSVISVGEEAFLNCNGMEEVKLSENLQTIGNHAFFHCQSLKKVDIPDSVTSIGQQAFHSCYSLEEVRLSENLKEIEDWMFYDCKNLKKAEIPDCVISIGVGAFGFCSGLEVAGLPENLQIIGSLAFLGNRSFKEIEIPNGVTTMEGQVFSNSLLETVKIPDHIVIERTFRNCPFLETLQIKVEIREGNVIVPVVNIGGIAGFGCDSNLGTIKPNRKLEFWTEDGSARLTGEALKAAQKAYLAVEDGDTDDNFWYGWEVVPEGPLAYEVTVAVNKDGTAWAEHGRTFKLTKDNGSSFIDISYVEDGTYQIYDFTDAANGMDTGVSVEVNGKNVTSETVNYYTATFYDGVDNPYGEDTRQKPQVVLSGTKAEKPADPEKANYRFVGWMNDEKGETVFDFNRKITDTTSIYAKWIENPIKYQHTITASAGEGGSISPRGSVIVDDGKNQEFLIVSDEGYEILSVKVDGIEQEAKGTYTFTNVTENHNINVEFIKRDSGEIKPTEPVKPENPTEPTSPENPTEPANPETPTEPTNPQEPTEPANPETPTEPTQPEAPTSPDNQGTPGDSDSGDDTDISHTPTNSGSTSGNTNSSKKDNEPVTSGLSHTDMYATIAMIAGISYLLLYFIEKKQGMSEEKKNKLIASLIAWAKDGAGSQKGVRRVIALVLIVLILFYYHAIGKKISLEWQSAN